MTIPFELDKVHKGDMLSLLRQLPDGCVDALVTDPPYCSGGAFEADPEEKYVQGGTKLERPTFAGDNRSQHGFHYWCALWMAEAYRTCRVGAYAMVFTDARMLPVTCDVLEAGGFIRRGVVGWDKTEKSRAPGPGYFRLQMEFVVWGTKGPVQRHAFGPFPGCYRVPVQLTDKHHLTGKPTFLMRQLLKPVPKGGLVLDPFAGSGTTLVACREEGLRGLGFEVTDDYAKVANERLS